MQELHRRGILNTTQDRTLIVEIGILQGVVAGDTFGGHDCRLTPVREEIASRNVGIGAAEDRYHIRRIPHRRCQCCHHRLGSSGAARASAAETNVGQEHGELRSCGVIAFQHNAGRLIDSTERRYRNRYLEPAIANVP